MASTRSATQQPDVDPDRLPEDPTIPAKPSAKDTLMRAVAEFQRDECLDMAAALTYYAVLSIFPGLLAITSLLGVVGEPDATATAVLEFLRQLGQQSIADQLEGPITSLTSAGGAGFALVIGIGGALWASSKYVVGFSRAMNRIYGVTEGRPVWKLRPQMLLITLTQVLIAALVVLGLVLSGSFAQSIGDVVGIGEEAVQVWSVAKWPVILLLVVLAVAILYYFTPNVRPAKFRWLSPGALIAIIVWVVATFGFGIYVTNFSQFEATFGSLAGVIIFLLWLWLTNTVLLVGAEIDTELERSRQLHAGIAAEKQIQLPARDSTQAKKNEARRAAMTAKDRRIRIQAQLAGGAAAAQGVPGADRGVPGAEHVDASVGTASLEPLPSQLSRLGDY